MRVRVLSGRRRNCKTHGKPNPAGYWKDIVDCEKHHHKADARYESGRCKPEARSLSPRNSNRSNHEPQHAKGNWNSISAQECKIGTLEIKGIRIGFHSLPAIVRRSNSKRMGSYEL